MSTLRMALALSALVLLSAPARPEQLVPRHYLVVPAGSSGGRRPVSGDPVQHAMVTGAWKTPAAGDSVTTASGRTFKWQAADANESGSLEHAALRGGYACTVVDVPRAGVWILAAANHSMVYVNGEPRTGDPYGYGYVKLPVSLHQGANTLLFLCGRGGLSAKLERPQSAVMLNCDDPTLPDLPTGLHGESLGAVVVVNAQPTWQRGLSLVAVQPGRPPRGCAVPPFPPLSVRKCAFRVGPPVATSGEVEVALRIQHGGSILGTGAVKLRIRGPRDVHKQTFISDMDGSVQYYGLVPPSEGQGPGKAMVLSLHGAGVEGIGQASSYSAKSWTWLAAPTNRRPYGFDWEDWGRVDALEVLQDAMARTAADPTRVYLAGHSMGGHGTWHVGAVHPGLFAAIAPSAGWVSFNSYAGGRSDDSDPVGGMLSRAVALSDTLSMERNYTGLGIYILHGDADDNVPVSEARTMAGRLSAFHKDWTIWEQPGAGHWWGAASDPGAGCVDWPGIFDMFSRHSIAPDGAVRKIDFTTPNPAVSSHYKWATVVQQERPLLPSRIAARLDPAVARLVGETSNIALMRIDLSGVTHGDVLEIELDGQKAKLPRGEKATEIWLRRSGGKWAVGKAPLPDQKGAERGGPFREALMRHPVLVVGTAGTEEENRWAFAKARFDSETFWYRGNGTLDLVLDTEFKPGRYRDRSVVLYGNSGTNRAWRSMVPAGQVALDPHGCRVGDRKVEGDDLGGLVVVPRKGSDTADVALVGGTGLVGMRATDRLPIFLSGIGYPDVTILRARAALEGVSGVVAAGFFGSDWDVGTGDWAWR